MSKIRIQTLRAALPLLTAALGRNSIDRVGAIGQRLFSKDYRNFKSKPKLIQAVMADVLDSFPPLPEEVSSMVADIGIVRTDKDGLVSGQLVLLQQNATSNAGEYCVAACEQLLGWSVEDGTLKFLPSVPVACLDWGHLVEKRRGPLCFNFS